MTGERGPLGDRIHRWLLVRSDDRISWQTADEWRQCCTRWGANSNPAMGCLMFGLLPEAWTSDAVTLSPDGVTWAVFVDGAKVSEETEKFAAMVAALEAAPS